MATTTNEARAGARATGRYLHVSPYKVRQVLELVRGLPVEDAERVLLLCEKDAAEHVLKLLMSAAANAEHNHELPVDELFVAGAWADEGPIRKAGRPRARGRFSRIRKRTSHITIVLERFEVEELEERRRRDETSGRGAAVAQRRRAERVRRSRAAQEAPPEEATEDEEEVGAAETDAAVQADAPEVEVPEAWADEEAEASVDEQAEVPAAEEPASEEPQTEEDE